MATLDDPARRDWLWRSTALGTGLLTAAWLPQAASQALEASRDVRVLLDPDKQPLHLLNRLTWGATADDLARVRNQGLQRWFRQQLEMANAVDADPSALGERLAALETHGLSPAEIFQRYGPPAFEGIADAEARQRVHRQGVATLRRDAFRARLWRITQSRAQLREAMTEFWFNHFNVFFNKGHVHYWLADYEDTIRHHAFGRFRDLLGAVAKHPAMLFYLDNWLSVGGGSTAAQRRNRGLNENYARELMELHTLGVDGGYTQQDVIALARILSGWTIDMAAMRRGVREAGFIFDPRRHDNGSKSLLGRTFAAGGQAEGEQALDLLAAHPSTARFIATKLVRRFVDANQPDGQLIAALAKRFTQTDGDLRQVMQTLFEHPAFWSPKVWQQQFKTPLQYAAGLLRLTGLPVNNVQPVVNFLALQGQPLYGWTTPDGYGYTSSAWLNASALLGRIDFAMRMGSADAPVARAEPAAAGSAGAAPKLLPVPARLDVEAMLETVGPQLQAETVDKIRAAPPDRRAGLLLAAPELMAC